jgi:3-oxoacyl-[acyl-carrier-protein] synthase II
MSALDAVAITGLSVLTPLGDDPGAVCAAPEAGRSAIEPSAEVQDSGEGRLSGFDAARYASVRGMRVYNRTTQLGICAVKLALTDAGFGTGAPDPLKFGLVTALTYGHLDTLVEYDRSLITVGVQRTNPTLMPLGIPNAPGSAIALSHVARAFSITLSDGGAAGLDAIALGARALCAGRADVCVVVSAFSRCQELLVSAQRAGMLAPAGALRVLDRDARGTAFGEAAVARVLERAENASARGAAIKGRVLGHASAFALDPAEAAGTLARACTDALRHAALEPARLALLCTGANGQPERDAAEARGLLAALGPAAERPTVQAIKGNLGESLDASPLLQAMLGLCALRAGKAPAIAGLTEPAVPGLRYAREATTLAPGAALISAMSPSGACSALVLEPGSP